MIVQAGASEDGRQIAAETAEMVFAAGGPLAEARSFYADVKDRMQRLGRNQDHLKILPGALVVVGDTAAEAKRKRELLDSLVHPGQRHGRRSRSRWESTRRSSISMRRCRIFQRPTKARAAASG